MTPQSELIFNSPMPRDKINVVRSILAGAQFFNCEDLKPIVDIRSNMPGDWHCADEIIQCELPADHTWIDYGFCSIGLSRDNRGSTMSGKFVNLEGVYAEKDDDGNYFILPFVLFDDGEIGAFHQSADHKNTAIDAASKAINTAWYCIEAMQTPGGLCHAVPHAPTRQQKRAAKRAGKPCHKWVEIRLGRARQKSGGGSGSGERKMIAWHYRRGHAINHPNPNFPKWRKGCWVGDTDAGIRTHNYIVEVPSWS